MEDDGGWRTREDIGGRWTANRETGRADTATRHASASDGPSSPVFPLHNVHTWVVWQTVRLGRKPRTKENASSEDRLRGCRGDGRERERETQEKRRSSLCHENKWAGRGVHETRTVGDRDGDEETTKKGSEAKSAKNLEPFPNGLQGGSWKAWLLRVSLRRICDCWTAM